ncbi:MAG: trigger factor [Candidatus Limivicinus sp.]|nr:trigger factor [Candidatus Limivicinus sp.]
MILKNVENKENKTATFQVESDAAEFESAVNGAYLKNKASINIPGFRKGKAPRAVVEGMYGAEVFYQDAMDELAPKAFEFGLDESKLRMVGTPSIVDVNVTDDRTASYTFEVTLYPEVTLGQYKGLEAERKDESVSDEDVDNELNSVRKRNARMIDIDDRAAEMGDTVDIDFDGYLDGERFDGGKAEGYSLELGSNSFVPGFEDQVVGMKIGEEKDIDITFPENYTPELAGKAVVFKIKLNGITTPELPELDDEFAKDVSEFDTLDEYKTSLRVDLEKRKKDEAENDFRANILKQAVNNLQAEIPECMILEKVEQIIRDYASNFGMTDRSVPLENLKEMMGLSDEVVENNIRPAAEFQVKTDLLLDKIKDEEKLEVTEEAFNEYLNKVAEDVKATADQLKNYFGEAFIKAEQLKEMATNLIVDSAKVKAAEAEEKPKKARKPKAPKAEDKAEETEAAAEEPKAE